MFNEITDLSLSEFSSRYGAIYRLLLRSLDENESWRILLNYLRSKHEILLQCNPKHGMDLLYELDIRFTTIKHLRFFLNQSNLLKSLALISKPEQLIIIEQPGEEDELLMVDDGAKFTIKCEGKGLPPPSYQWYFGNIELDNESSPKLTVLNFREKDCGEYYCVLSHDIENERISLESNHVVADLTPIAPQILENGDLSKEIIVAVGKQLVIGVLFSARPYPEFTWKKDGRVLEDLTCNALMFESILPEDEGVYSCVISNPAGVAKSTKCKIEVILGPENSLPNHIVSHKIALLIGNSKYSHLEQLRTPSNDVALIAQQLFKLKFYVIALQDLNFVEMKNAIRWFNKVVPPQSYAFFYFAGHGFLSKNSYKYMMPVDATEFNTLQSYPDKKLVKRMMGTNIRLFFMVLDVCSEMPKKCKEQVDGVEERAITYNRNKSISFIKLSSASDHMSAYDGTHKLNKNSLYAECLAKYLPYDYPAFYVAMLLQSEFKKCSTDDAFQIPNVISDDAERLSLAAEVPVYVDPTETQIEMQRWNNLNEKEDLHFKIVDIRTHVNVSFHKGCFQNALDFVFPVTLNEWVIRAELNHENLKEDWTLKDSGERVLTIYNLQKAVSVICVTFQLYKFCSHKSQKYELVDFCQVDLNHLGVVDKKLSVVSTNQYESTYSQEILNLIGNLARSTVNSSLDHQSS